MRVDPTTAEKNLSIATEYFKLVFNERKNKIDNTINSPDPNQIKYVGGTTGFIPFKLNVTLDGISGFKIYQKLNMNTAFLPPGYDESIDFIITGIDHNLKDNDWETTIKCVMIPKFEEYTEILTTTNFTYVTPVAPIQAPEVILNLGSGGLTEANSTKEEREYFIFQYFKSLGWSKIQTAAALGNIRHETILTFSPSAFNDRDYGGTTDIGLIQWNSGNQPGNPGQTDKEKSKQMLLDEHGDTVEKQLDYLINKWKGTDKWLKNPKHHTDVSTSTYYFAKIVEVCHLCNGTKETYEGSYQYSRTQNAENYINVRFNDPNDKLYWP